MVSPDAFAGVRGFAMVISFSAAVDDAVSNQLWKDSIQFLRISLIVSTKSLAFLASECPLALS